MNGSSKKNISPENNVLNEKFLESLPRGRDENLSSSSSAEFWQGVNGVLGEIGENRGLTLSQAFEKTYHYHWSQSKTIRELWFLSKHGDVLDEIEQQRAFTRSYIAPLLGYHETSGTLRRILAVLVKRKLLFQRFWAGKAKKTWGVNVYYATNVTREDIEDTLREYEIMDDGRYFKELQQKKSFDEIKENTYVARMAGYEANKEATTDIRKLEREILLCSHNKMPKECLKDVKCKNFKHRKGGLAH